MTAATEIECTCENGVCRRHARILRGRLLELYRTRPKYRKTLDAKHGAPRPEKVKTPPRTKPCVYLDAGATFGVAPCNCPRKTAPIFGCDLLGKCTVKSNLTKEKIFSCQSCPHYRVEEPTINRTLSWAVGVTTSPRKISTIDKTIETLGDAGWVNPFVFSDKGDRGSNWPNWWRSFKALSATGADAILIVQDDTLWVPGARELVDAELWPSEKTGLVSLYRNEGKMIPVKKGRRLIREWRPLSVYADPPQGGYQKVKPHQFLWGALAYVINAQYAEVLLRDEHVHSNHSGNKIDKRVGLWPHRHGLDFFVRSPSLVQHRDDVLSSVGHGQGRGMNSPDLPAAKYWDL